MLIFLSQHCSYMKLSAYLLTGILSQFKVLCFSWIPAWHDGECMELEGTCVNALLHYVYCICCIVFDKELDLTILSLYLKVEVLYLYCIIVIDRLQH